MDDGADVVFPARRASLGIVPAYLCVGVVGVSLALRELALDKEAVATLVLLPALAALVGAVLVGRMAFVHVRLTADELVAPRVLGSARRLPLRDIAGLGMQYASAGQASGWSAYAWLVEGDRVRLSLSAPVDGGPPRDGRRARRPPERVPPELDWDFVADGPAGEALRVIAGRVTAVQGRYGRWQETRREEQRDYPKASDTAYWAPDGRIGVLRS